MSNLQQLNQSSSPSQNHSSSPSQNHSSSPPSPLPSFSFVASDTDVSGTISIDDYDVFDVEVQQELISALLSSPDNTITSTATAASATTSFHHYQQHQVRFVAYPYYLPQSPSLDSSSSYITINGNEETCGSSFSDTCSLMASFDTCGVRFPDAFSGFHNHLDTFNSRDTVADADAEADVWDWSDFLKEESCFLNF